MKKSLLALLLVLTSLAVLASPVDQSTAVLVARNFALSQLDAARRAALGDKPFLDAHVIYTHTMPASGNAAIYAVDLGTGFVLVSADDVAHPVLGYNLGRTWPKQTLATQVSSFLDDLARQIESAVGNDPDSETAEEWQELLLPGSTPRPKDIPDSVGPLLTTTWDQGQYYNALCPEDPNGPDGHCVTGCVATAMAQIINYWGYPIHGRGIHSYSQDTYGTLTVNYDSANYDYAHMPNALTSSSTEEEIQAVATLMRDCGVSVNMRYAANESGALVFDIRGAMTDYFIFSPYLKYTEKESWPEDEWIQALKSNVSQQHPMLYGGSGDNGGHMFICDGYNDVDFFHFNFGWSGACDGWYQTSAVSPNVTYDFSSNQNAFFDILPAVSNNNILYAQQSWGQKSIFCVSEPMDLLGVMENNQYPFINGWMQSGGHTFTFIPSDTTKQLVLYIMDDISIDTYIYDGSTVDDSLVRSYVMYAGFYSNDLDLSPIVATNHAITVRLESAAWDYGNHFLIAEYDGCDVVSGITATVDSTTVHLRWGGDSGSNQWEVEFGYSGFSHGEGTSIVVDTNSIEIEGLLSFKKYDFYIRQICEDGEAGLWSSPVTEMIAAPLWTDVVNESPYGYESDSLGNITISTAEAFAWFAKMANQASPDIYRGKTVSLISDVNMGDYVWNPINEFCGIFDGGGHIIDSLYVMSNESSAGIINFLNGGTVKNINLVNGYFRSKTGSAGGIVTYMNDGSIYNCLVCGEISGGNLSGGIAASAVQSKIINCVASGKIEGGAEHSGICGYAQNACIFTNCYSSVLLGLGRRSGICGELLNQSEASHCYASRYRCYNAELCGSNFESIHFSNSFFIRENDEWKLTTPVDVDGNVCMNLIDALNRGVVSQNNPELRLWVMDTIGINEGMPILSNIEYQVTCPNVSNVILNNVMAGDNYGVEVSWLDENDSGLWEIRCLKLVEQVLQTMDTVGSFIVNQNPYTLLGLNEGETYMIQVRSICDTSSHSGWSERKSIVFDRPYWNDIVTTQPDGYVVDLNGDITISTEEGLAWLSSVVNGQNGQIGDCLSGKTVRLDRDVNMGRYKWNTINNFSGVFDGGGHKIDSLLIREASDCHGFFANTQGANIRNVVFDNANVKGHHNIGTICGGNNSNLNIKNCKVTTTLDAFRYAGGVVSSAYDSRIDNCSSTGSVYAVYGAGGIAYQMNSSSSEIESYVYNCYSNCTVSAEEMLAGGIIGGNSSGVTVNNCYSSCSLVNFMYAGGIMGGAAYNVSVNNCYTSLYAPESAGYLVNGSSPWGIILGLSSISFSARNVYYQQEHGIPLVGGHEPEEQSCILVDTMGFDASDTNFLFSSPVIIGGVQYSDLLSALNAWVDTYDTAGIYRHWAPDLTGENGGFPIFADTSACPEVSALDSITVCDNYTWHGADYVADAVLIDTLSTVNGCDSVVSRLLTVNYSTAGDTVAAACDSFEWWNTSYTNSTDNATHALTNAAGCDSIITLHLTVNNSALGEESVTSSEPYTWHGTTYDVSGTYTWIGTTTEGCDSTVTLHLVIEQGGTDGIDDVEAVDNIKVYTRGKTIVMDFRGQQAADSRQSVIVYDVMGRVIKQAAGRGQQAVVEIPVTAAGVYMVKVGEQPSRKVVVRP